MVSVGVGLGGRGGDSKPWKLWKGVFGRQECCSQNVISSGELNKNWVSTDTLLLTPGSLSLCSWGGLEQVGAGGGWWGLTKSAVSALIARGAGAGVGADVVLARPVVEAGLGDTWGATCREVYEILEQVALSGLSWHPLAPLPRTPGS